MMSDNVGPKHNDATSRSDRDRFVAFAFCWADMLIEIDATHTVVFAAGPTEALIGGSPAALQGQPVLHLFIEQDRGLVTNLLSIAAKQGRFDNTTIRLQGAGGPTRPLDLAGYRLADMEGHYYLALRLASVPRRRSTNGEPLHRDTASGLYDAESFNGHRRRCA